MGEAGDAVGGVGADDTPLDKGTEEGVSFGVPSEIHGDICDSGRE